MENDPSLWSLVKKKFPGYLLWVLSAMLFALIAETLILSR